MANRNVNWNAIKEAFITSKVELSYRDLANQFSVAFQSVRIRAMGKHAMNDGVSWMEARKQFMHAASKKALDIVSTEEAEIRAGQLKLAKAMRATALTGIVNLRREGASAAGEGDPGPNAGEAVDPFRTGAVEVLREIRLWLAASTEIERKAIGIPDGDLSDLTSLSDEELQAILEGKGGRRIGVKA